MVYKARNNKDVNREDIIKMLASLATHSGDYPHTVDLNNPDLTIWVEIIKVMLVILMSDYVNFCGSGTIISLIIIIISSYNNIR